MGKSLPNAGMEWSQLEPLMSQMTAQDIDWRGGRAPLYVFFATNDVEDVGRRAFTKFMHENALGGKRAFHGIRRMEEEVVSMGLGLLSAPVTAAGVMTTGGTESIVLAVKGCRDWYRDVHADPGQLNIVIPHTAHPAFNKAGDLMDIAVRRVPPGSDLRADADAMARAIDDSTMMIVGSAPCFPHGLIDPIAALGAIARDRNLWLHVDACVGGYLAPFVRMIGRDLPDFDFAVDGVRSISADLHKFGFCPKPASTLFYRFREDSERQAFDFQDWPNGRFATDTLVGTRPAGGVAAAWAVLNHLGRDGYMEIAERLMRMMDAYAEGVEAIEGLHLWARPELTILNFGSHQFDIFAVAEEMTERGWLVGLTQQPRGMHAMMSLLHDPIRDEYLEHLRSAVEIVRAGPRGRSSDMQAAY